MAGTGTIANSFSTDNVCTQALHKVRVKAQSCARPHQGALQIKSTYRSAEKSLTAVKHSQANKIPPFL
jgi:hypothetical protein